MINLETALIPLGSDLSGKGKIIDGEMKSFLNNHTIYTEDNSIERAELLEDFDILLEPIRQNVKRRDKGQRRAKGVLSSDVEEALNIIKSDENLKQYSLLILSEYQTTLIVEALLAKEFSFKLQEELLPSIDTIITKKVANEVEFHENERMIAIKNIKPQEKPQVLTIIDGFEEAVKTLKDQGVSCHTALSPTQ